MPSSSDSFAFICPYFFPHCSFRKRSHVISCLTDITCALFSTWIPGSHFFPSSSNRSQSIFQSTYCSDSPWPSLMANLLSLPEYRVHSVTLSPYTLHTLAVIDIFVSFSLWDIISFKPVSIFFNYILLATSIVPDRWKRWKDFKINAAGYRPFSLHFTLNKT